MSQFKVFCPKTKQVKIKFKGNVYAYKHGDTAELQEFFSKYPHIFHKIMEFKVETFTLPEVREGKGTLIDKLPDFPTEDFFEDPQAEPVEFKIESPTKGWYIVTLNGDQVFPEETGKKCRKSAADKYVVANS